LRPIFTPLSHERLVYATLFLFPVAGNSIRSWTGIFFGLLFAIALFPRNRIRFELLRSEIAILITAAAIFTTIILSNLINGWDYPQTKGLGVYVRWLMFIPIYLCVRCYRESFLWLANGTAIASMILLYQCLAELAFLDASRAQGVYDSPGLIGVQSLVFLITLVGVIKTNRTDRKLLAVYWIGLFSALVCLILSGSRSTYILSLALALLLIVMFYKPKKFLFPLMIFVVVTSSSYLGSDFIAGRVNSALLEMRDYITLEDPAKVSHTSVGARLEMWKVSILIAKEAPMLGVGWRNFHSRAQPFSDQGLVSVSASKQPHPHNTYLEFLVTTGILGLLLLVFLLVYSARIARESANLEPVIGNVFYVFVLAFAINAINEGGAFIYGNALSFFLIYFAVLLAGSQFGRFTTRP
jgi:O-antigen ligase